MKHNYRIIGHPIVDIVVEMGLGSCLSEWMPMAKRLGEHYGVLLYERAGINKSEGSDKKRTPLHIANELYELLENINHKEQLIIVGHSQGGLYAQQFARLYPNMVKGLILLDPLSAEDNMFKKNLSKKEYRKSGVDKTMNFKIMYRLACLKLGFITKALLKNAPPLYYYKDFKEEEIADILGCTMLPKHAKTALEEYEEAHSVNNTAALRKANSFPNIPMILITHSSKLAVEESIKFGNNTREFAAKIEEMWQMLMKQYVKFTTKSTWMEAKKSTHYIHLMEPEIVEKAVESIASTKMMSM